MDNQNDELDLDPSGAELTNRVTNAVWFGSQTSLIEHTVATEEVHMANSHMVTGECDARGTNSSQMNLHMCNPHLVAEDCDTRGGTKGVMGRQISQTDTEETHRYRREPQVREPTCTQCDTEDTATTHNNPIEQLAHAIERIAANKQRTPLRPVTASTLIFDGKNEKFELFEDFFHTMLKMQPEMTERIENKSFSFASEERRLYKLSKTSKVPVGTHWKRILVIFRRKYVKPQSVATAKHKWHKLMFNPSEQSLPDFLEELHQTAERAFGDQAQCMIVSLLYAKMPPSLKKTINHTYSEDGTYQQIIKHIEREMELNGLEQGDDLAVATMTAINRK